MSETYKATTRRIAGPFIVDASSVCHGTDSISRIAIRDQTPGENLLCFIDPEWAETIVSSLNARPKVEEIIETIIRADKATDYGDWCDWEKLVAKAREVEAALGGKAE